MRQRPIRQLAELLNNLGARISHVLADGFPPVIVDADGIPGGLARFGSAQSSQYLSAVFRSLRTLAMRFGLVWTARKRAGHMWR